MGSWWLIYQHEPATPILAAHRPVHRRGPPRRVHRCGFDPRIFADALGQATQLDPDDFAQYGVTGPALDKLRSRFAEWRRELLDDEER